MTDSASLVVFAAIAIALTIAMLAFVLRPLARGHRRIVLAVAFAALLVAPVLYVKLGAVRVLDDARVADAPTAASTRAVDDMREDLVAHLAQNARDSRGWVLLARLELAQDRFSEAAKAYERALTNAKAAADTTLWCEYAEALALAQGGRLGGRPREIVGQALARDPTHRQALELAGTAAIEEGEYPLAASYWRMLLAQLPEGSGERGALGAALARVELLAAAGTKDPFLH
jgi:cytochrome c-type biogenesis protein CcmH